MKISKVLEIIVVVLVALPFLQLLPVEAEAQPIYLFFMMFLIIFHQRIKFYSFLFAFIILVVAIYSTYFYGISAVLQSFVALCTPLIVLSFLGTINFDRFALFLSRFLPFYVIIALIQQYASIGVSSILLGWLKLLIPRLTLTPLSDWDRGISIVGSEPSSMAPLIFCQMGLAAYLYQKNLFSKNLFLIYFSLSVFIGLLTMAITFLGLLLYIVCAYFAVMVISGKLRVSSIFTVSLFLLTVSYFELIPSRLLTVLDYSWSIESLIAFNNLSGNRLGIIFGPYCNLYPQIWYMPGFGAWSQEFLRVAECMPFDITANSYMEVIGKGTNVKPSSTTSLLLLDFGIIGFLLPLTFIALSIKWLIRNKNSVPPLSQAFFLSSTVAIVLGGFPLTLPQFWIIWYAFYIKSVNKKT